MKLKTLSILVLSIFLFSILASYSAFGLNIESKTENNIEKLGNGGVEITAGSITINNNEDDIVSCSYKDNFDIDVGDNGATVIAKVNYNIKCPGFADGSYVEIKFTDGSDKKTMNYDGDHDTGIITISKFVKPGDDFTVKIYAKLTDWYGTVTLNEDSSYSYHGACPGVIVNVGEMKAHYSDITINPKNPDEANPEVVELSPKGGITVIKCNWDVFFPNPLYTTFSIKANGGSGHSDSITVKKWCGNPNGALHIGTYLNAYQKISISLKVEVKWAGEPPEIYAEKSWILAKSWDQTPSKPTIKGPAECKIKTPQTYEFTSFDNDKDDLYYYIEWGDGQKEEWIGPYKSGETISVKHTWSKKGDYKIVAQAKDETGLISQFSEHEISVRLSRNRHSNNLLQLLLTKLPKINQILNL